MKQLTRFLIFACLGVTTEIHFTAFSKFLSDEYSTSELLRLEGHSYVWMIFIYGSAAFLVPVGYNLVKKFPFVIRLFAYAIGIFTIEYIAGFILDMTTGSCPWEYSNAWNVSGYIRLDYMPFWMVFGFVLEKVHLWTERILKQ